MIESRDCWGRTDPHHVGHYGQGRANDHNTVPLCRRHHDLAQQMKRRHFEQFYGVNFEAAITGLNDEFSTKPIQ